MSEENTVSKVNDTINAVTGLVKAIPIYEDAIQPVAKQLGKSLGTVGKLVNVALAPVSILIWGYDKIEDFIQEKVPQKLVNIAEEDIITPNPHIAAPLIEALRYTGNNEELREMFANLLANSMDKNTEQNVHPAYVDIIKNITSDEAKILKYFEKNGHVPALDIILNDFNGKFSIIDKDLVSTSIKNNLINNKKFSSYLNNLLRLGLIQVLDLEMNGKNYDEILSFEELQAYKFMFDPKESSLEIRKKIIKITDFGFQFIFTCVKNKD